jgi:hypothetical protein
MDDGAYKTAISQLKSTLNKAKIYDSEYSKIVKPREEVLSRYQPVFASKNVYNLSEVEFKEFLIFRNNRHWTGLHRMGPKICKDMDQLRKALSILQEEAQPISYRLNQSVDMVPGMGKAIVTAILLVTHPDRYGVWNRTSEEALKKLDIWPSFARGTSFGEKYEQINEVLNTLASDLNINLWELDSLLWQFLSDSDGKGYEDGKPDFSEESDASASKEQRFYLERHLHEFLRDNWDATDLGKEWMLYEEQGDPDRGYEFPCAVGRIDLLAKHRTEPRWLVVELKRDQSSDTTLGQVLRYMGWVRTGLSESNEQVEGLIISHSNDENLLYALKAVPNVNVFLYEVKFNFTQPNLNIK